MPAPLPSEYENPFTIVYDKLWQMAEANYVLEKWLDIGNKEKFEKRVGQKKSISTSDTPELILFQNSTTYNLKATSSSTRLSRQYIWGLATGDQRVNAVLNQVSWELFRSMLDWENHLCGLKWDGEPFILQALLIDSNDSPPGDLASTEKGILGWTSLWTMEVQMQFATDKLRILPP